MPSPWCGFDCSLTGSGNSRLSSSETLMSPVIAGMKSERIKSSILNHQ